MKTVTKFVAVLFGHGRGAGPMTAPGDADCRWRAAVALGRVAAVNDDCVMRPDGSPPRVQEVGTGANDPR